LASTRAASRTSHQSSGTRTTSGRATNSGLTLSSHRASWLSAMPTLIYRPIPRSRGCGSSTDRAALRPLRASPPGGQRARNHAGAEVRAAGACDGADARSRSGSPQGLEAREQPQPQRAAARLSQRQPQV
jgi:hypothetical protein